MVSRASTETTPSRIWMSLTMSRSTMLLCSSGSWTSRRAASTCSRLICGLAVTDGSSRWQVRLHSSTGRMARQNRRSAAGGAAGGALVALADLEPQVGGGVDAGAVGVRPDGTEGVRTPPLDPQRPDVLRNGRRIQVPADGPLPLARRARTVQPQRPPSIHGVMAVRPDDAQHRFDNAADVDRRDHAGAHRGTPCERVGTLPAHLTAAGCRRDPAVALPAGGGGGAGGGARGGAGPWAGVGRGRAGGGLQGGGKRRALPFLLDDVLAAQGLERPPQLAELQPHRRPQAHPLHRIDRQPAEVAAELRPHLPAGVFQDIHGQPEVGVAGETFHAAEQLVDALLGGADGALLFYTDGTGHGSVGAGVSFRSVCTRCSTRSYRPNEGIR